MKHLWYALIARRRSLVATIATCIALLPVGGCSTSSLYFHNQGYEDTTTEVKKQVDTLDVAGAFKTLNDNAKSLADQEDAAIIASTVALRNERLSQLIDPIPGDDNEIKTDVKAKDWKPKMPAAQRLKVFVSADITALAQLDDQTQDDFYRTGAERFRLLEKAVAVTPGPASVGNLETFLGEIKAEGAIKQAAGKYLKALHDQKDAAEEAETIQKEIEEVLKKMKGKDPASFQDDLKQAIDKLDKAGAAAQLAGLTELETFLKCGLIVDLEGVAADLDEDKAVLVDADKVKATEAAAKTKDAMEAAKTSICPTVTPQSDEGTPPTTEETARNAMLAAVITVVSEVTTTGLAADRLKRIDANIVALSNLRQRLGNAKAGVAYNSALIPLFRGYIYALLDQYRLLARAGDANKPLLGTDYAGFTEMRDNADYKRNAAWALSSYASAWNYGKIPAVTIDFRFKQARRKYDLDVASSSAANYKAVVQPLTDALAQYGKGGITPDTIALIISQIGIFSALIK